MGAALGHWPQEVALHRPALGGLFRRNPGAKTQRKSPSWKPDHILWYSEQPVELSAWDEKVWIEAPMYERGILSMLEEQR